MRVVNIEKAGQVVKFNISEPTEHLQKDWQRLRFYEGKMLDYIKSNYDLGGTFMDVGAAIGNHTLFFAKVCQTDKVVSIEPVNSSYNYLVGNINLNSVENKVIALNLAVSDANGSGSMEKFFVGGRSNRGMHKLTEGDDTTVKTIDSIVTEQKLENISLMKMDVEFNEVRALRGASNLLSKHRPILFIEIDDPNNKKIVIDLLNSFNYKIGKRFNSSDTYEFIPE